MLASKYTARGGGRGLVANEQAAGLRPHCRAYSTAKSAPRQALAAELDRILTLEEHHVDAARGHEERAAKLRARRRQVERLLFGGRL